MVWHTMAPSVLITPELTATAGPSPWRWKKRTTRASVATVPPTRPVKLLANCTPTTGFSGSGRLTEPSMAMAPPTWGSWEKRITTGSHTHSASWMMREKSTWVSSPSSRYTPRAAPAAIKMLPIETRWSSSSSGASMPVRAATASRRRLVRWRVSCT